MRAAWILAAALAVSPTASFAQNIYIETGRLLDVQAGQVLTGQCISVAADKITAVAPCGATPAGSERLDWSAYTVLPGLIDLHTHLASGPSAENVACGHRVDWRP
ncbi:hypothetical protein [Sphingorhabdus sp.]|uniref:hypothetical protein n=1 Tax=Sphingorhabdus sp. TaxID=1902408 RepID=UPI0039BC83EC